MFLIDSRRSVLKDIEEDESSEDVADDIQSLPYQEASSRCAPLLTNFNAKWDLNCAVI